MIHDKEPDTEQQEPMFETWWDYLKFVLAILIGFAMLAATVIGAWVLLG